jgi:KUP system potassium uptake protein
LHYYFWLPLRNKRNNSHIRKALPSLWKAVPLVTLFLAFDMSYFLANLLKIMDGGWFTLLMAILLMVVMTTWKRGRAEVLERVGTHLPLKLFLEDVAGHNIPRVPSTAVFMTFHPEDTSLVLLHHFKHTKILYERVVLLSILPANIPIVRAKDRVGVNDLGQGFHRIVAYNGYMQRPNVPGILRLAENFGLHINPQETPFYLGRVTLLTTGNAKMMRWRKGLFSMMLRMAGSPTIYFGLPAARVVELGAEIEI